LFIHISKHDIDILSKTKAATAPTANANVNCNCRNTDNCPPQKNCQIESVVDKAEVGVGKESSTKEYIGMTSTPSRSVLQITKPRSKTQINEIPPSYPKKEKRRFSIKWTILKQTPSYRSGAKNCHLCLQEKLHILKGDKRKLLNKRWELFSKCRHRKRFLAEKFERACAVPSRV
jgi:hypothetical protein